jgi:hypothetical protein
LGAKVKAPRIGTWGPPDFAHQMELVPQVEMINKHITFFNHRLKLEFSKNSFSFLE